MAVTAGYCTPMLTVADVPRSLRFYALLGFETRLTAEEDGKTFWARANCEGGALMFTLDDKPVDPAQQSVVFYMYTPDLPALRDQLVAGGLEVSPIRFPEYMPGGEIALTDPDGYQVLIGHWNPPAVPGTR
jgi:catechol 2,3-dioxygenase-like lactoylglutathione lyase family enzyme